MGDIVNELREIQIAWVEQFGADSGTDTLGTAADEIERLRLDFDVCNRMRQQADNANEKNGDVIMKLMKDLDSAQAAARYCGDALNTTGDGRLYMQALALWPWINPMYAGGSDG